MSRVRQQQGLSAKEGRRLTNVVVIGAGVLGTSVAWRASQAGASVTVLEADRVGSGTSGTSFAWTNANNKLPQAYHDLNVAGMRAYAALRDELGATPWWHGGGSVEWESGEAAQAAQRTKVDRLRTWGYAAEWITAAQLHEMEPDLNLEAVGDAPIAYYPEEGWLDPVLYAHAMMEMAVRLGARLRTGTRVADLVRQNRRVTGVTTAAGETIRADVVVNCAGRWANEVVRATDLHLPLAPTVGFLVFTAPMPTCLYRIVRTPLVDVRPDGAGRLMLHCGETDQRLSPDADPSPAREEAEDLVRWAAQLLPGIRGARPEAARLAIRPIPADGHSAVGYMPGAAGYYVVVTHSAVTLAALLGRVVADEIVSGRPAPQLAPFRPDRFFR
jgi:glycine/D-amino acid oxidase-like deaminating enzyme